MVGLAAVLSLYSYPLAALALAEWEVPGSVRAPAAQPLRTFLEVCGGQVCETTLQNCCGGPGSVHENPERAALSCADCELVVFVFEADIAGE